MYDFELYDPSQRVIIVDIFGPNQRVIIVDLMTLVNEL